MIYMLLLAYIVGHLNESFHSAPLPLLNKM